MCNRLPDSGLLDMGKKSHWGISESVWVIFFDHPHIEKQKKSGEIHRKCSNTQKPFNHHVYHFSWHVFHCLKTDMFFSQVITVDMKVSIAKHGGPQKVQDGLFHGKSMTIKIA